MHNVARSEPAVEAPVIRADAHIHLFRGGFLADRGIAPVGADEVGTYQVLRREHDIACALVVAVEHLIYAQGNNRYVADLARSHDWIAPVAYVPCWPPPTEAGLDDLVAAGFVGVTGFALTQEAARQLAEWPRSVAAWITVRFDVVSFNVAAHVIAEISPLVGRLHGCTVLFSHLGLPGRHATPPDHREAAQRIAPLIALAGYDHVAVKISGYTAISDPPYDHPHRAAFPFAEVVLKSFGARRLLWASNYSAGMRWVSFPQVVDLWLPPGLGAAERADILGGNLLRVLGRNERDRSAPVTRPSP